MEFPNLGQNCSLSTCNSLDFLPVKCDACKKIFCFTHMRYEAHECPNGIGDHQVPVCPLCNSPVPLKRGESPDEVVSHHLDAFCLSEKRKKVYQNKCSVKGCKKKEIVPIVCPKCSKTFCIRHRLDIDHQCQSTKKEKIATKTATRPDIMGALQGNINEDEALARALALSLDDMNKTEKPLENESPSVSNSTGSVGKRNAALYNICSNS